MEDWELNLAPCETFGDVLDIFDNFAAPFHNGCIQLCRALTRLFAQFALRPTQTAQGATDQETKEHGTPGRFRRQAI